MIVNCGNVNTLPYADKLKLKAGKNGLDRIIKWVHYMENPEYIAWLKGGELILTTCVLMKDVTSELLKLVKDLNSRKAAGLVVNVGPYIHETPKEVIDAANFLGFPIFELPFEVRFIDISQSICKTIFMGKLQQESMNSFMKNIIHGDIPCSEEIINRAVFYGYDPDKVYCTFVIYVDNFTKLVVKNKIWDEEVAFGVMQQISQVIINTMNCYDKNIIRVIENNSIIVMFLVDKANEDMVNSMAQDIVNSMFHKLKHIKISIGIGGFWQRLKDLKYSVNKAEKALKILKIFKSNICSYDEIGIYRLLFQIGKKDGMEIFYHEILGKLIDYDTKNSTKLVETLKTYIDENCNLIKTAKLLFIHKNTLKYRIKRIEEISNCDLKDMHVLLNFDMAFKVKNFITCI
ncbi:PucR family transcriptional regulator [Clostridium sp. Mt-5]|uniref:PucR family transcriptional regulator n=1 Tax=Clostridium moutaii TaxID=3240932 RepID=A0ABV4BRB7_9CLOT